MSAYENERGLQELVMSAPQLIPQLGDAVVVDEFWVDGVGSVDLLAVDLDGGITLVECKLAANPEIRRAVLGQVLAYAGGLWATPYESFETQFATRSDAPLVDRARQLAEDRDAEWPGDALFRQQVARTLASGDFRLVIAVDQITTELKRCVEYLNVHSSDGVEVLAVEVRYARDDAVEILVPAIYGEETARLRSPRPVQHRWSEGKLFTALEELCSPEGVAAVRRLFDWSQESDARFVWGTGPIPP